MWEYIAYTVYGHIANGMGSCMLSCDFERFWCRLMSQFQWLMDIYY